MENVPSRKNGILIIEDDDDIRCSMAELFRFEGYTVDTAANGQEALEQLRSGSHPDLIILDLMMPVMDGMQFIEEARREKLLTNCPIIVLSGDGRTAEKAEQLGIKDYLVKPVGIDMLYQLAGAYCGPQADNTNNPA